MSKRKPRPDEAYEITVHPGEEVKIITPRKKYVAIRGLSFDQFKARLRPGDVIPLEYLEDARTDFDGLLSKGAIKEILED